MTALGDRIEGTLRGRTLAVVGVGNRLRGDDAAGSLVLDRLVLSGGECVLDAELMPENFLGALLERAPGVVLFVDAADLGSAPGTCRLAGVDDLAPRAESTHAPSLRLAARVLAARGIESLLLGIQPGCTTPFAPLSPEVELAVNEAAGAISGILAREVRRD